MSGHSRNENAFGRYLSASFYGVSGPIITALTGLAMVWLLNAILGKDQFGLCMIAVVAYRMVAIVLGSGLRSIVLYHVSRVISDEDAGKDYLRTALTVATLIGVLATVCGTLLAQNIATAMSQPGLEVFFVSLALTVPLNIVLQLQGTWLQARQKIREMVIFTEILPNVLRTVILLAVWAFGGGILGVAISFAASLLFSSILAATWTHFDLFRHRARMLTRWDIQYGAKLTFSAISQQQLQGMDTVIVGSLASAAVVAEYSVATRLMPILLIGQMAVNRLLAPRIGFHAGKNDIPAIVSEISNLRIAILLVNLVVALGIFVCVPPLLALLGEFDETYNIVLIFAATSVARSCFNGYDKWLEMQGYAGWSMAIYAGSFITFIGFSVILFSYAGAQSPALALFVNSILWGGGASIAIQLVWRVKIIDLYHVLIAALACAGMIGAAFSQNVFPTEYVATILSILLVLLVNCSELSSTMRNLLMKKKHSK